MDSVFSRKHQNKASVLINTFTEQWPTEEDKTVMKGEVHSIRTIELLMLNIVSQYSPH